MDYTPAPTIKLDHDVTIEVILLNVMLFSPLVYYHLVVALKLVGINYLTFLFNLFLNASSGAFRVLSCILMIIVMVFRFVCL